MTQESSPILSTFLWKPFLSTFLWKLVYSYSCNHVILVIKKLNIKSCHHSCESKFTLYSCDINILVGHFLKLSCQHSRLSIFLWCIQSCETRTKFVHSCAKLNKVEYVEQSWTKWIIVEQCWWTISQSCVKIENYLPKLCQDWEKLLNVEKKSRKIEQCSAKLNNVKQC